MMDGRARWADRTRGVTPCRAHRREAGFTLIELMAAIFIVGLGVTMVVLAWPQDEEPAEREAKAFQALAQLAMQESIVSGSAVGLLVSEDDVTVYQRRQGEWLPVTVAGLATRVWDEEVGVVVIEPEAAQAAPGRNRSISARARRARESSYPHPQIFFDATGAATPFEIVVSGPDGVYRVAGSSVGEVRMWRDERIQF